MVKHKAISAEEHDVHDFQALCNFLPSSRLGMLFSSLSFLLMVK
jgi:hypothetical protein